MVVIGGRGQLTSVHEHQWPCCQFQILGEKRLVLFAPEDVPYLHRCDPCVPRSEFEVDALDPDLERHPDFQPARPLFFTLRPGQMLYLPERWPHQVGYESPLVISIDHWGESEHATPPGGTSPTRVAR